MSEPNYPEKHKSGSCNDGQCKLCEEESEMDREAGVDERILEEKENRG